MHPLIQGTVLIMAMGLFCLAPTVGRAAYPSFRLARPGEVPVETSRWLKEAPSALAGKRTGHPVDQHRGGVLLAKASGKSKKKG